MLIGGTLHEYPFFLLLEIFLHRKETGLLEVSSAQECGYFYIKNGKVKDGHVGATKGLAAIKLVGNFRDGSFRFRALEPAEYARVAWQRSFGPTGLVIGEPARSAPVIANKLSQFGFLTAAARRIASASFDQQALRQFWPDLATTYRRIQNTGSILIERTAAYVSAGFAIWKRAQAGTKILTALKQAFAALPNTPRRNRPLRIKHSRELSLQASLPHIPSRAAITSALQQGVDHNVIFALTVTVLLGVSGVSLYHLVFQNPQSMDASVSADEHFDTAADKPANTKRPGAKPKRPGARRRSPNKSRERSRDQEPGVRSTQKPDAVSVDNTPGISDYE